MSVGRLRGSRSKTKTSQGLDGLIQDKLNGPQFSIAGGQLRELSLKGVRAGKEMPPFSLCWKPPRRFHLNSPVPSIKSDAPPAKSVGLVDLPRIAAIWLATRLRGLSGECELLRAQSL